MGRFAMIGLIALSLLSIPIFLRQTVAAQAPGLENPLIVEKSQGEVRFWRPIPSDTAAVQKLTHFVIKVDRRNGGSPDFWFGTETMPAGGEIPYHRHLHEDEMLYLATGTAHVHVGPLEGDAHAGAIVFIPRDTWVTVRNIGKTPVLFLFAFNAPSFDRYMRCESVPPGQPVQRMTAQEDKSCEKLGDVQYR